MPWKETSPMKERLRFVVLALEKNTPISTLCKLFGISRETGYKWLNRYEVQGFSGLEDLSRKPLGNKRAIETNLIDAIISIRSKHPLWGPKKLAVLLKEQLPNERIPVASTIGEILERHGLIKKRSRQRRRFGTTEKPNIAAEASNDVWCTDFKGHFLVGDGQRCHPLTITDAFSRYLISCESLTAESGLFVKEKYEEAFQQYGLPRFILSDNGTPFSSRAPGGISRLSAWWLKLGITPIHIQPGHPEQNGSHERMHRTLKAATAYPAEKTLIDQQKAFEAFKEEFNQIRPHEALGQKRPAELYSPSIRHFPKELPTPVYPAHFETRQVKPNGEIKWKGNKVYLSESLTKEPIGLEEIGEDTMLIYFCHLPIALLNEHKGKITPLPSPLKKTRLSTMSPV